MATEPAHKVSRGCVLLCHSLTVGAFNQASLRCGDQMTRWPGSGMAALEGMLPNGQGPKRGGSHLPPWEPEAACQLGRLSILPLGASQVPPREEDATTWGRGIAEQRLAHSLGIQDGGEPGAGTTTRRGPWFPSVCLNPKES